ncbi:unnamed protein product [Cunninghamella echinulata]
MNYLTKNDNYDSEKEGIIKVATMLKTKLQYAQLKVLNGMVNKNFQQVVETMIPNHYFPPRSSSSSSSSSYISRQYCSNLTTTIDKEEAAARTIMLLSSSPSIKVSSSSFHLTTSNALHQLYHHRRPYSKLNALKKDHLLKNQKTILKNTNSSSISLCRGRPRKF